MPYDLLLVWYIPNYRDVNFPFSCCVYYLQRMKKIYSPALVELALIVKIRHYLETSLQNVSISGMKLIVCSFYKILEIVVENEMILHFN